MNPAMPRTRSARDVQSPADKRAAILDAAIHLFVEFGFHGTAVPQVAKRAGVGAGTIYRYFESKEALVNEAYREWKQRLSMHLLAQFAPTGDPYEQFIGLWRRMADFLVKHPTEYAFIEIQSHADYLDEKSVAIETQLLGMATACIVANQAKGDFRPGDPAVIWSLVEGAFIGFARFVRGGRVPLTPESIDLSAELAWELVRPR